MRMVMFVGICRNRKGKKYPGDIKFADLNGDNIIDNDDQTKIGNPKRPAYTFGLNLGGEYKGFFCFHELDGSSTV